MDYVSPARPPALADATIKLDTPWKGKIDPGTLISIKGAVAESFNKESYAITMRVERSGAQVLAGQQP